MPTLIDTNVLLRSIESGHKHHAEARESLVAIKRTDQLVIVPQVLYEFGVVCSRPIINNGYGLTTNEIVKHIEIFLSLCQLHYDNQTVTELWLELASNYQVQGKPTHDCRLVAAMITHDVQTILTFNTQDFRRYTEIRAISPGELVAPTAPSTDIQ